MWYSAVAIAFMFTWIPSCQAVAQALSLPDFNLVAMNINDDEKARKVNAAREAEEAGRVRRELNRKLKEAARETEKKDGASHEGILEGSSSPNELLSSGRTLRNAGAVLTALGVIIGVIGASALVESSSKIKGTAEQTILSGAGIIAAGIGGFSFVIGMPMLFVGISQVNDAEARGALSHPLKSPPRFHEKPRGLG